MDVGECYPSLIVGLPTIIVLGMQTQCVQAGADAPYPGAQPCNHQAVFQELLGKTTLLVGTSKIALVRQLM